MNKSECISELAKALVKAQADFGPLLKGSENPFFKSKYADLSSVMDVARGPLSEHGLCFVQTTEEADTGSIIIETTLIHASGEWLSGRLKMPLAKNDPQGYGSAMTYARRYALQAILGLAAEDDDAEGAMTRGKTKSEPKTSREAPRPSILSAAVETFAQIDSLTHLANHFKKHFAEYQADPQFNKIIEAKDKRKAELATGQGDNEEQPEPTCITASEAADLQALAEEVGADTDKFKEYYKIKDFADLPANQYKQAIINLTSKRQQPA